VCPSYIQDARFLKVKFRRNKILLSSIFLKRRWDIAVSKSNCPSHLNPAGLTHTHTVSIQGLNSLSYDTDNDLLFSDILVLSCQQCACFMTKDERSKDRK
jgi:hypothetical protein